MNHRDYIDRYVGAHADDELSAEERLAVSEHLANCEECRDQLAIERTTKAMVQKAIPIVSAPDALRRRIIEAFDAEDRAQRKARARISRRPMLWIAATSIAAAVLMLVVNLNLNRAANPTFDAAIAAYLKSEQSFTPTVGAGSNDDLALAMINQFGVPMVWDFSSIGLAPAGGRIDHTTDGKAVAYSMYKGSSGSLLCIIKRTDKFNFPSSDQVVKGIHLYRYKGFSIAATDRYAVFCVMVTRLPIADLARGFADLPA